MFRPSLALAVALALLFAAPARADLKALEEAARKEGQVTWYTAHTGAEVAEQIGRAFTQRYPGIRANVIRTTSQVAYQRLQQDLKSGTANCDVFSSADVGHSVLLKRAGKLARYEAEGAAGLAPAFRDFDRDRTSYPTMAGVVFLIHNTSLVKPDQAPARWTDLLDPRWKSQVALGHPAFSGTVGTWVLGLAKLHGWDYFEKLERNRPLVGRSIADTLTMLNSGERRVGHASGNVVASAGKGNPLAFTYPEDGTVLIVSASAILANAPHPNAARLFLEFLLGPEHQAIIVADGRESIRPDIKQLPGVKPISEVKLIPLTADEIADGVPAAIERWRDIFGN